MSEAASEPVHQHEDAELVALMNRAARALENAGLTAQDLIDELPSVQEELLRQDLGDASVDALARLHATMHENESAERP